MSRVWRRRPYRYWRSECGFRRLMKSSGATNPQERTKKKKTKKNRKRGFNGVKNSLSPCSFLAVKTITPVSSPTMHSAIRTWRTWLPSGRAFCSTSLALTTFTVKVWPEVPGRSWSTLVNTGFRRSAVVAAISSLRQTEQTDRQTDRSSLVFRRIFGPLSSSCLTKRSTDAVKNPGRNRSFSFSKTLY